jgi:adenylate kinase
MKSFKQYFSEAESKRIILMGGPGSGKSTYAEFITKEFNIPHIYPGGMLRKEIDKNTDIGKQVKPILAKGGFVPNEIVLKLIKDAVSKSPDGYVLDGWPRYMTQVKDMQKSNIGYDYVVFLDVSKEEIIRRLTARGRKDDTPEIIKNRIALYNKETGPAVEYFKKQPNFISIKAEGGEPKEIANKIIDKIK